ncbi:MAG: Lnb N-terminal periplasmic domain-containing protein [Candidatus Deferrimicrobiaceae bacterium]
MKRACIPRMRALSLFLLVLLAAGARVPPSQAADDGYLAELKGRAESAGLHEDRYWRVLLHVRPGIAGTRSLVDDPRFFLSPSGKTDPAAELSATLDGLFDNTAVPPYFCRFPARYSWLARSLGIDPTRIPRPPPCPEVDNILRTIDGQSVAMVFASGYVNSPASMFGHTFLRIDSKLKSPLLSFAVNYAARTDPSDGGIAFTAKGMLGGYQGFYSVMPYYDKVREYSNIDQRDLWEYSLNLPPDQVRRMLLHLVEMKDIATDYFFFDENCSYELLFLLDAAQPEARLTETMDRYWVIPMDTVRAVIGAGLVDNVVWRPSRALLIGHARSLLPDREADLAVEIVDGTSPAGAVLAEPVPDATKARTLDLAALLAQYRIAKKGMEHKVFQERFHAILSARTRLDSVEEIAPPPPVPAPPDEGHRSARAHLGGGWRGSEGFLEAGIRPAYHDYTDPPEGYTRGSLIEFMSGAVRWYPERDRVRLSRLDLIRIESLDPFDRFFRKKSWKVRMGFETRDFTEERDALVSFAGCGIGGATQLRESAVAYLLGEVEGDFSRSYHGAYRIGGGASAGITAEPLRGWRLRVEGRGIWGALGETGEGPDLSASLRQGFRIGRDLSLTADVSRSVTRHVQRTEGTVALHRYF